MQETREESIKKLGELIKGVKTAMLTTMDWGILRSRPMGTQDFEFDGDLWFFTSYETHKVDEIEKDRRVNVSYAAPDKNIYVSVSGTAILVNDRAKIEEYWNPIYTAWFPEGKDDPNLVLLKVTVEQAEYWNYSSGVLVQVFNLVKALVSGESGGTGGVNQKINL
jgi:general stress protein 26